MKNNYLINCKNQNKNGKKNPLNYKTKEKRIIIIKR